jgi:putative phosphoribosyl transferase
MVTQSLQHLETYGVPLVGCDDRYEDRATAGRLLAERLQRYRGGRALVLALPPGGIAVAGEVARALRLPLDVLVVSEIRVRSFPNVVVAALSEGGGMCLNAAALRLPGMSLLAIWAETRDVQDEIAALAHAYRHGRPLSPCGRRPVILVDDGLGTGLTQLAAVQALRRCHPQECVVATPWATAAAAAAVARHTELLIALASEEEANDRGDHWQRAIGDDDAVGLLDRCRRRTVE